MNWFNQTTQAASQTLGNLTENLTQSNLKIAVTGLSRSGKTVFIMALIYQILHGYGAKYGAKIVPQTDLQIPAFNYHGAIEGLFSEPSRWPTPTSQISTIKLAVRYPQSGMLGYLQTDALLHIDIIDYPGEWLLDLALLNWTFEEWSQRSMDLNNAYPRNELAAEWRAFVQEQDWQKPIDDPHLKQAGQLYAQFLKRCKAEHGLSLLQPGRFIMPGDLANAPMLDFCPMLEVLDDPPADSGYATLKRRYEYYKQHVVRKFYSEHFGQFNRQILLVDLLSVLNRGKYVFDDMSQSLDLVLQNFRYGKNSLFNLLNLFTGHKIDRVLFAATKGDHVTRNQIGNMERLLRLVLKQPQTEMHFEGVKTDVMALASVRCTQDAKAQYQGREISVIKGLPVGGDKDLSLFPGEVPAELLSSEDWKTERFQFTDFRPPRMAKHSQLPQLNFEKAIHFLIGDYLR